MTEKENVYNYFLKYAMLSKKNLLRPTSKEMRKPIKYQTIEGNLRI